MSSKNVFLKINSALDRVFNSIGSNKIVIGILMLFMNLCSRHIIRDLSTSFHTKLFSSKFARRFSIFTILFIATRDVKISLILTAVFVIIFLNLLNENSDYCILPNSFKKLDINKDGEISDEEIEHAYNVLKKAGKLPSTLKNAKNTKIAKNANKNNKIDIKLPNNTNTNDYTSIQASIQSDFIHNM
jgi:hypothetical protein